MGFLSGPVTFQCFRINGDQPRQFGPEQVETLRRFAIGQIETASIDAPSVGFLAGAHLFDLDFDLAKNVIGDALHCGMRIDVNQIPGPVRKAWLQLELAALTQDNPGGRPTKLQRQEAKEAVAARCEEEARNGRFRRMQQVPLLWDALNGLLYCGGTSGAVGDLCCDLFAQAFGLDLTRLTAGKRAQEWSVEAKRRKALDETIPAAFHANNASAEIAWWNQQEGNFDFLGNEFLLWLWWYCETQFDTIALPDGSEVTGMFARTLSLQCPRDESGKESISAESPTRLPEAGLAVRSGKLPRKAGLTLVRHGEQYELALQAETFAVGGAKIIIEDAAEGHGALEDRIESLRSLQETLTLLFEAFCQRRVGKNWSADFEPMRRWLKSEVTKGRGAARP